MFLDILNIHGNALGNANKCGIPNIPFMYSLIEKLWKKLRHFNRCFMSSTQSFLTQITPSQEPVMDWQIH